MKKNYSTTLGLLSILLFTGNVQTTESSLQTNTQTKKHHTNNLIHLENETQFNQLIAQGSVIVDFYADWCGPCRRLSPIIEALADIFPDITFIKVDTDTFSVLSRRYKIRGLPALIFIQNGREKGRHVGFLNKRTLIEKIKNTF